MEYPDSVFEEDGLMVRTAEDLFHESDEHELDGLEEAIEEAVKGVDLAEEEKLKETVQRKRIAAIVPLDRIIPNPNQPRKVFDLEELKEMAKTIKAKGDVVNPVLLTNKGKIYMLVSGERRWRAAKMAGISKISAVIEFDMSPVRIIEDGLIANLHQKPMSIIEEAYAYRELMEKMGLNQSELARRIGKKQGQISNALKVFSLHEDIQTDLLFGKRKPGTCLMFASFPVDKQLPLLEAFEKELNRLGIKKLHPNKATRIVRKLAEKMGINPLKPKKSRPVCSHAELVISALSRVAIKAQKEISEFRRIEKSALEDVDQNSVVLLISLLEEMGEMIEDAVPEIKEKIGI